MSGLFITLEGVEGAGKSTQLARLNEYLLSQGFQTVCTREPGGTPIAEAIRNVLLDPANHGMTAMAELFLYEAARAQHVEEAIRPALNAGQIVLCDRFADSTTAYQGAGRGLRADVVKRLHHIATAGLVPDLTLILDLPAADGLARARGAHAVDRIEGEPLAFHERVRAEFLRLACEEPLRVRIVDGTAPIDAVAEAIRHHVEPLLERLVVR